LINRRRTMSRRWPERHHGDVFLGVGLCSPTGISVALPFDVLGLILLADSFGAALGGRTTWLVLPDEAAREKSGIAEVERAAGRVIGLVSVLRERYRRDQFAVLRTSTMARSAWFESIAQRCLAAVGQALADEPSGVAAYARRQLAQMAYMEERLGCSYKVGWALDRAGCRDESFFDGFYEEYSGGLHFVYGLAGRSTAQSRPRACPYVTEDRSTRIILSQEDDVEGKVRAFEMGNSSEMREALWHYDAVVKTFEARFEPVGGFSLAEKIKRVIRRLT